MIDLHTHSTAPTGATPPERVVELAAEAGCTALALTDHDTLDGLAGAGPGGRARDHARARAARCPAPPGRPERHPRPRLLRRRPGRAPSATSWPACATTGRPQPAAGRAPGELGIPVTYDQVVAEAGSEEGVGRPHFAAALVDIGAAESVDDAFDRYLGNGRPAYVPKARLTVAEVCRPGPGARGAWRSWPTRYASASRAPTGRGRGRAGRGRARRARGRLRPLLAPTSGPTSATWPAASTWWPPGARTTTAPSSPTCRWAPGTGDLKVPDRVLDLLEAAARAPEPHADRRAAVGARVSW